MTIQEALQKLHEVSDGDWWMYCLYDSEEYCEGCQVRTNPYTPGCKGDLPWEHAPDCPIPTLLKGLV